jgi:hypothetical protein
MILGMNWAEVLLLGIVGWTAIGVLGLTISFLREERAQAIRHLGWIVAVWFVYLAIVVTVSLARPRLEIALGKEQCFGKMCFAVLSADVMPAFLAQNGEQVVRVAVRITNHSTNKVEHDAKLRAYLMDAQGRRWQEMPGLEGVRLTATVSPGVSVISEPVFKVARDATGFALVLTHGRSLPGALIIGGPDSLFAHPVVMPVGR